MVFPLFAQGAGHVRDAYVSRTESISRILEWCMATICKQPGKPGAGMKNQHTGFPPNQQGSKGSGRRKLI